ncbi:MAG: hypothetical protein CVU56_03905 [Deltaproteobacteria bacterium HGW-Deltaproteobacteria-14]|jgi:polyisoprenoid-binding protein YceI|nr:MAG: hypothetical protein CVU56_03905 [Deltaproteobacteria bacterium HGW-Deltaproteobacteria-14]
MLHVALPTGLALASAAATGLRYGLQGTGNIYTNTARAFYLEDPILGWSVAPERWVWLGLDALGAVVAVALGTLAAAWLTGALARRHRAGHIGRTWPKLALVAFWLGAALCLATPVVPIAAFASGAPPAEALAHMPTAPAAPALPRTTTATADPAAWPDLPAGAWVVTPHGDANTVIAQIAAGEETFDARFGPVSGAITVDPTDLTRAHGEVTVPAASIDTGIALRSKHASDDLRVTEHPAIGLRFGGLTRLARDGAGRFRFEGTAAFTLMGTTLDLPITGSVTRLTAAARAELGLEAAEAILIQARLEVPLARTPLGTKDFDKDTIAVSARFILAPPALD